MIPRLVAMVEGLDSVYRGRPYFVILKARLLAAFNLLVIGFVPLNVLKLLWIHPPGLPTRFAFNFAFMLAAAFSLYWVRKGCLELAGSALVLFAFLPIHLAAFLLPSLPEPVGAAIQMFIFDLVILLFALVFATRGVALGVLILIVLSHAGFYFFALRAEPLAGSLKYSADILVIDGLIAIAFVFSLGAGLVAMIDATHRRSDESLRETRSLNENLERLVAERTTDLELATQRANEASRAKGDFLANMSHEIRTPLNGIIASADLLQHQVDFSPEAAEQARLISESGDLLLKLLGDILDFSKIEAGQLVLERHAFALTPLVADTVALVAARAKHGGVQIHFTVAPGLARYFEGDSFRLRQILLNLLSNAIKFTPPDGHAQIAVSCSGPQTNPVLVRFEVRDSGIGMDAATVKKLFERFTQADSSTTRRFGGTGLGLAISSHLVEMMGGRIEVESVPAEGSTFHFTIPLQATEVVDHPPVRSEERATKLGLHVLVAEDNAVNRKILMAQLQKLGCTCTMASNGEEVLQVLPGELLPDVILMDCHMPQLDGWEATRRIRQWAGDPQASAAQRDAAVLPIIALTAAALPEDRAHCLQVGMTDFLAKPVRIADLQRVLQGFIPAGIKVHGS